MWGISWWQAGSTRLLRSPTFSNNLTSHTIDNAIPDHSHTMDRALDRSLDDILGDRKQVRQKPTSPPPAALDNQSWLLSGGQLTQGCRTTAEVLAAVAVVVTDPTILEMASERYAPTIIPAKLRAT